MTATLADHLVELHAQVAELRRRINGMVQQGPVTHVDAAKGLLRLRLGGTDGEPFLSPWIPYAQMMGALKVHTPPAVGQQYTAVSVDGDYRQGLAIPMTQSDQNKSPSQSADENVATFGGFKITLGKEHLVVANGGLSVDISGSRVAIKGDVTIEGKFDVTGPSFTHNSHDVGATHLHTDVMPGGALSGPPQ